MNDETSAAQSKRHAEFAEYLQLCQNQLYGFIHSLVRDSDDADDIFQQTSIVLWRQFEQFDRQRNFLAWACGVARLEVANYLRSRSRKRLYFSDDINLLLIESQVGMTPNETDERQSALGTCMQKLRPRDLELLQECYSGQKDVKEVAERMGRIPQSVHNTLRRIRRSLFECIHRSIEFERRKGIQNG